MSGVEASIYSAIGKINPHESSKAIQLLFQELQSAFAVKLATLWKINGFSRTAFPLYRLGYNPRSDQQNEFSHDLDSSFIGAIIEEIKSSGTNYWFTDDVQSCQYFGLHRAKERVAQLDLRRMYCVPFRNFHAHPDSHHFAGILNLYVTDAVNFTPDFLIFLSLRLSDIYSSSFIISKDRISDAMLDIFSTGITKDTANETLSRVLKEVCGPMLMADAATIYEWDAHRFCFIPVVTTGLQSRSQEITRHGLIDFVASRAKPLLISNIRNPDQVQAETRVAFEATTLLENLELTLSDAESCLLLPIMNPAHTDGKRPVAVLKLLNKKPFLGARAVHFDYDDIILGEEVGRVLTLYEEQVRLSQSREAFALLFGHEAQAPASGIRGTADRILYRAKRDSLDRGQMLSLVQDIFDFAELVVSFAESLTFGFKGHADQRLSRFNPRMVSLSKPIDSAKRVVIPICRYEKLQYDNIKITGPFPDLFIDQRAMMQVFYNFFTNAIKYRRRGEKEDFSVSVRTTYRSGVAVPTDLLSSPIDPNQSFTRLTGVFIEVSDYGMGIDQKHGQRIFSEGFRAPEVGRLEVRGSGIGLSVVKNIVVASGGEVWLARSKDPTTFVVYFPAELMTARSSVGSGRLRS